MAKLIFPSLLLLSSLSLVLLFTPSRMSAQSSHSDSDSPAVHIVYVEKPRDEQPEAYHIRILTSVLVKKLPGKLFCIATRMLLVPSLLVLLPIRSPSLPNKKEFYKLFQAVLFSCIQGLPTFTR
ncbi:uncharacterized protein LOC103500040 isoform X2 [Cucumis melo]|uniref:Uncharacterized protein LOC103500040 isoform X2 n=1 Tax=Cucumis melo TaxID=3656 RepID=A0ABM3KG02_CUCME|nr:uncharacterized protein LOC103500040 isoform X2 [Cucumis melo]